MIATLVAVFILSGAAGLIYESIWSRYLGLFVGHSAYAQIIVLVVFLGGMSLGAHLASRWSTRLRSPLFWYAIVELAIGLVASVFHSSFIAVTNIAYSSIFPSMSGGTLDVVKWLLAGMLILPQSVLLGATFPLMTAGVIRMSGRDATAGRILALLYFANSLGAAVGVLIAGLWLVVNWGLPGTLLVAALCNVVAAAVAAAVSRIHVMRAGDDAPIAPAPATGAIGLPHGRQLLWIAFGTAVASFIYEIAWIRMLSLVLGAATHSFEVMLSAFILGLALGSWWVRTRADTHEDPLRFLGVMQWAMGLLAVATLPLYVWSFDWMSALLSTVQRNDDGYRLFLFARYLIALIVMLPATFCAGTTLPLITRMLMRGPDGERAIGRVYAVNTLGSIVGVILAGLLLMPVLGLKRLLVVGACIDIGLGIWLIMGRLGARERAEEAAPPRSRVRRLASERTGVLTLPIVVTLVLLITAGASARFDLARVTSGVYRHGVVPPSRDYKFPFYKDGRTATVSLRVSDDGFATIATNGKPDASMDRVWIDSTAQPLERELTLTRDISTQFLLPIITLAHAPRAQNVAVIGHGSGMSSHVLLGSPYVLQVVTCEIEPEMIHASRGFYPANRRVFDDRRSLEVIDDAKSYFASSGRKFDLIMSEPSNPWVSGVSGLFTREFYARVRTHLAPHGVFGQWLHLYELNDQLVSSVLLAIDAEFTDYDVYFTSNSDILIVAANTKLPTPDWSVANYAGIAHDLRHAIPLTPETFAALHLGGRGVLHPMLLAWPERYVNSDFFPILDLGAERMRFARETADGYESLANGRFDVVAALTNHPAGFGALAYSPTPEVARADARALGSRIRTLRTESRAQTAALPVDDDLSKAMYRIDAIERMVSQPQPPPNWHSWVNDVVGADAALHTGTAGVVDTQFFARLRRFVAQPGTPPDVRAAVTFLHGIGTWNWREAADAGDTVLHSQDSEEWLPDTLVYDGTIVAHIKLGEYDQAKEILRVFARKGNQQQFQERLIAAFLAYSDPVTRKKLNWH